MKKILVVLALALVSCDPPIITGPDPTPEPPPPDEGPLPEPPVARGPSFAWDNVRGLLLFAGTQGTEPELSGLIQRFRTAWPHKQFAINVCSETSFWKEQGAPWNDGPAPFSQENLDNLRRFLRVTAEQGVMVKLNIFCTVRDHHDWMDKNWERYVKKIVGIAKEHDHLVLSPANEPGHNRSWLRGINRVRMVRDAIRTAGWRGLIGVDEGISPKRNSDGSLFNVKYSYRHLGFIPEFHPFRDPGPKAKDFRQMVRVNGLPLVISEPTAYSTTFGGRCCTSNKGVILGTFRHAERHGIVMFHHSTTGLLWPDERFKWIPVP